MTEVSLFGLYALRAGYLLTAVVVAATVGPILLFEIVWKSIWLIAVALPLWSANQIDAGTWETA
jgi:hypothetical protein